MPSSPRRARGMPADERRSMIVQAALPLVAARGDAVTTAQVARAAGIGEATIFRVFADKGELLEACLAEALCPDRVLADLAAIPLTDPLPTRLAGAATAIETYLARMGQVIAALQATGHDRGGRRTDGSASGGRVRSADGPASGGRPAPDRDAAMDRTRDALTALLEPDRDTLRLPPEQIAEIFMGTVLAWARPPARRRPDLTDFLAVFLHGATTGERTPE
ncbi:TetR/AcrR family transcriptional regulator [Actinomadura hibisca]|uniref:TetR/AcrR family transcriptional regulator n=1 Tax=Actinomadura hibisca TaxID=68565 RepID=UPI00082F2B76|nr:TetR/AcrR family transcriptional regulator [Actinomadura hibisca]